MIRSLYWSSKRTKASVLNVGSATESGIKLAPTHADQDVIACELAISDTRAIELGKFWVCFAFDGEAGTQTLDLALATSRLTGVNND